MPPLLRGCFGFMGDKDVDWLVPYSAIGLWKGSFAILLKPACFYLCVDEPFGRPKADSKLFCKFATR